MSERSRHGGSRVARPAAALAIPPPSILLLLPRCAPRHCRRRRWAFGSSRCAGDADGANAASASRVASAESSCTRPASCPRYVDAASERSAPRGTEAYFPDRHHKKKFAAPGCLEKSVASQERESLTLRSFPAWRWAAASLIPLCRYLGGGDFLRLVGGVWCGEGL